MLVAEHAEPRVWAAAVRLMGSVWGGTHWSLHAAGDPGRVTAELAAARPDVVVTFGLNKSEWAKRIDRCCQPFEVHASNENRWESALDSTSQLDLFHVFETLEAVRDDNARLNAKNSRMRVLGCSEGHPWEMVARCAFGCVDPNSVEWFGERAFCKTTLLGECEGYPALVNYATEAEESWDLLDINCCRLRLPPQPFHHHYFRKPTLVLIDGSPASFEGYWNHRPAERAAYRTWFPVPVAQIDEAASLEALGLWAAAARKHCEQATTLRVVHGPNLADAARRLANELKTSLQAAGYASVELVATTQWADGYAIPWHDETIVNAWECGREVRMRNPKPPLFSRLGSRRRWMVELVEDIETGQPPLDFMPPRSHAVSASLHAGAGTAWSSDRLVGRGFDRVTLRCQPKDDRVQFELPTDLEAFEALARERGLTPVRDEKRENHEAAIDLFGSLEAACSCLEKLPLSILEAFLQERDGILHQAEPITRELLFQRTRLNPKRVMVEVKKHRDLLEKVMPAEAALLQRRRIQRARGATVSPAAGDTLTDLLRKWLDASVLMERFRLVCSACGHPRIAPSLDLSDLPVCGSCGHRLPRPEKLERVLRLNPIVSRAITQGAPPVLLAARCLQRLSKDRGMSWVAGFKANASGSRHDFDLLATSGNTLISAECKTLTNGLRADAGHHSEDALKSVKRGLASAAHIGADMFVYASFSETTPSEWREALQAEAPREMTLLFLNRLELDRGRPRDPSGERDIYDLCEILPGRSPSAKE